MTQALRKIILVTFFIVFLSHVFDKASAATLTLSKTEARRFPLCVTHHIFEEYKANLPDGVKFRPFLDVNHLHHNRPKKGKGENIGAGTNAGSDKGVVESIEYFRILADCTTPAALYANCRPMRQWVHIHLKTKRKVKGLIVQSITEPFSIPTGRFDIEFACTDCNTPGADPGKAETGDALDLNGKAAVIPCDRRTYIHVRHPNVYAYASEEGRSDFHFNYNWMDVTCRHMSKVQFMIFATEDWNVKNGKTDYFFTAAVDHVGVDSIDGMPYPWHPIWAKSMKCHVPDDQLKGPGTNLATERSFKLQSGRQWTMAPGGNDRSLDYDVAYDLCIRHYDLKTKLPKYAQDPNDTSTYFISRRMCNNIPQTKCNYSLPINDPSYGSGTGGSTNGTNPKPDPDINIPAGRCTNSSGVVSCFVCTNESNCVTSKLEDKLLRRDYLLQRIHGMAAIFGLIALNVINIHISRYFKEAGGCCMLVGWWLWAHLALSYISLGAVWLSLALVTSSERPKITVNEQHLRDLYNARECLLKFHKGIGFVAVIIFHIDFIFGAFRPISAMLRCICICVHASSGYIVVVIAAVAVYFSTSCMDLVIFTFILVGFSLLPWIIALALQFVMDGKKKLNPKRKLFPVIEAVQVQPQLPMRIPRFVLLGLLIVVTTVLFALICVRGGRYKGWFVKDRCTNCEYKLDEKLIIKKPGVDVQFPLMSEEYHCKVSPIRKSQDEKFAKWISFCEKIGKIGPSGGGTGDSEYAYDE